MRVTTLNTMTARVNPEMWRSLRTWFSMTDEWKKEAFGAIGGEGDCRGRVSDNEAPGDAPMGGGGDN